MFTDLAIVDEIVLLVLLLSSIVVGIRAGKGTHDVDAYLLGGRSLPWWAILGSIVATETSTATVLSVPGEAFSGSGLRWLQITFGYIVGRTIVATVFLPRYFQGTLFTAYEVLQKRFGTLTQRSASILFLVARNLGDGLRLFLAGIVLQSLLGWSFEVSVAVMGIVTIIYTVIGGLRSVVWNDCIQFVIYMVGGIAAVFVLADRIPGHWSELTRWAVNSGKLSLFDFRFTLATPFTFWAGLLGGATLTIGTHGTDHMMVQRYLSAKNQKDAAKAVITSGVVVFLQFALFLFIGIALACFYSTTGTEAPAKPDQVFVHFIQNYFPRNYGLIGIMMAAVLAAAMSTLSSSLNASASAVLNDFWVPLCRNKPDAGQQLNISRGLTIAFGILQTGIGIWASHLRNSVVQNAMTIAGFSAGILLGVFTLGVFTKRVSQASALIGALCGLIALLCVQFVISTNWVIAWPWFALIGSSVTVGVGLLTSLFLPAQESSPGETTAG